MNAPGSPPNRPDSSSGSSTVSVPSSAALSGDEQVGHLVQIAVPTSLYIVQVAVPANLYSLGCCPNKFIQSRLLSQLVFIQSRLLSQQVYIVQITVPTSLSIVQVAVPTSIYIGQVVVPTSRYIKFSLLYQIVFFTVQQVYFVQVAVPTCLNSLGC